MSIALTEDMDVGISEVSTEIKSIQTKRYQSGKVKATNVVRDHISARLYTYFKHWKNVKENFSNQLVSRVKDLIVRLYCGKTRSALLQWRKNATQR